MLPAKRGTIVLVGSTSGLVGRADHLNLAVGKFGLRAISQVMARVMASEIDARPHNERFWEHC